MKSYPFKSISINGRKVNIEDIRLEKEKAQSDFELNTFSFIKDWLFGGEYFSIRTSGSTGTPKTITIGRAQMIASAKLTQKALRLRTDMTALICLDTKYIAGKMMLVRSFEIGMQIIAVDPSSNPFKKISHDTPIDFTALVPLQLNSILESPERSQLTKLSGILVGGASINTMLTTQIQALSIPVYATYGMTETISHIALQRLNGPDAQEYFQALPSIQLQTDKRGCLVVSAPYLQNKIITNDIVEPIGSGKFKWLGRWDNVINSGGVKISPEQVETKIGEIFSSLNINNRFFVSGVDDEKTGTRVILIIEGELKKEAEASCLSDFEKNLSKSERPRNIYHLNSFEQTENSKINRKACLEQLKHHI